MISQLKRYVFKRPGVTGNWCYLRMPVRDEVMVTLPDSYSADDTAEWFERIEREAKAMNTWNPPAVPTESAADGGVTEEREACAKVAERYGESWGRYEDLPSPLREFVNVAREIAGRIRARGEKQP